MTTIATIQARTGSTRLPGKVMYPLDGTPTLAHVVERVAAAETVDRTVVATSTEPPDEVVEACASRAGAAVVRGSEADVLGRFECVVEEYDPDVFVRVTADCPLVSPDFIDTSIDRLRIENAEYVCAALDRTFPRGVTCEAFTADSFARMRAASSEPRHREHVTPYYREHPDEFCLVNIESTELFDEEWLQNRTDLRLTLDEPEDYHLLERVYWEVDYDGILDVRDAIRHIDQNGLAEMNEDVKQKTIK